MYDFLKNKEEFLKWLEDNNFNKEDERFGYDEYEIPKEFPCWAWKVIHEEFGRPDYYAYYLYVSDIKRMNEELKVEF